MSYPPAAALLSVKIKEIKNTLGVKKCKANQK